MSSPRVGAGPLAAIAITLRWIALGAVIGALAGAGSAAFLHSLEWATRTRERHGWLLWLLPVGGAVVGLGFHRLGGRSAQGTNLVLDEVHLVDEPEAERANEDWANNTTRNAAEPVGIPSLMAPLVLVGATATHLLGGSGGREGAAVQIAASVTDTLLRVLNRLGWVIAPYERRVCLRAAIAAGFGSIFGTPVAGAIFGLEMPTANERRYDALAPAFAASIVGDQVTRHLGIHHFAPPALAMPSVTVALLARVLLAAIAFGAAARLFIELTERVKHAGARMHPEARLAIGGSVVLLGTIAVRTHDYNGLSLPLISAAVTGAHVVVLAWLAKLAFTAVTVGTGFPGGEVTPLFCVGACLGSALAGPLGGQRALFAALGYVAVFGAASNTPITFTVLAAELFGADALLLFAIANVVAHLVSGRRSVYARQRGL